MNSPWSKPIQAVAFDMDGLMVNTEELYTVVGETILSRRGKSFTLNLKRKMMGLPGRVAWQVMIDEESLTESPAELAEESDQIFTELLNTQLRSMPGLFELLDYLDANSIPRCVATSSSHLFATKVLGLIGITDRFSFVVTAEDVQHGKPHPDIYQLAATRMEIAPQEMLVLEDSENGARAGIASGACTIAVPGDHSREHDFTGAFEIVDSLASMLITNLLSR